MAKSKGLGIIIGFGRPDLADGGGGLARRRQHAADIEADFLGKPQPHGTYDAVGDDGQVSAQTAGYMELDGAAKDGDCDLVAAAGGVSGERGCCNLYEPKPGAEQFACGACVHFTARPARAAQAATGRGAA